MSGQRNERIALVHLVALFSLAIAYPLLELLGRSPEFFVAHRLEGPDLAAFVLIVAVVLPLLLVLGTSIAGRLSGRLASVIVGTLRPLLVAAIVLMAARHLPAPGWALVLVSLAVGVAVEVGCRLASSVRLFVALLAPAFVLAPLLFVFWSPASRLFRSAENAFFGDAPPRVRAPVVLVVFDQLPLVSLIDADGRLDRSAYPSFAALADTATWYRQASSVADRTEMAIPAILTGRSPRRGQVPTASGHPDNLFTGLAPAYALHVQEPMTRLCPPWLCPDETPLAQRLEAAGADASIAYLHRLLPADLAGELPDVRQDWRGFWHKEVQDRFKRENLEDRRPFEWVEAIAPDAPKPTLHFLHVLLPHEPFIYLPTGQMATTFRHIPGLYGDEQWTADEWQVASNYQRHLLQVGAADQFLGKLLARLKQTGLFDRSLVIVCADHGASFRPGGHYKKPDRINFPDIMNVPLLVKLPGQREKRISDRPAETIDIVPTIMDVLRVPRPGQRDGRSLLDESTPPRANVQMYYDAARRRHRTEPARLASGMIESARRKIALFGPGPAWNPRMNFTAELVGRPVAGFPVDGQPAMETRVDRPQLYRSVDPSGYFVPALITGSVRALQGSLDHQVLAVAVNGTVLATSRVVTSGSRDEGTWSAMVRPDRLRAGANDIAVYEVEASSGGRFTFRSTAPLDGGDD
jgi:hypothetical protein